MHLIYSNDFYSLDLTDVIKNSLNQIIDISQSFLMFALPQFLSSIIPFSFFNFLFAYTLDENFGDQKFSEILDAAL